MARWSRRTRSGSERCEQTQWLRLCVCESFLTRYSRLASVDVTTQSQRHSPFLKDNLNLDCGEFIHAVAKRPSNSTRGLAAQAEEDASPSLAG